MADLSVTATLAQTIVLLALSREQWPKIYPPATRFALARHGWIGRDRLITAAGREALAASPFLAQAGRTLERYEPFAGGHGVSERQREAERAEVSEYERQIAQDEIELGKSEVRELIKERARERSELETLGTLGIHATREERQRAKGWRPPTKHKRKSDTIAEPTGDQPDSLWRDLDSLVRTWLPDWMEALDLGDDGPIVRVIARKIRSLGPVREHTANAARAAIIEGKWSLGEEMLYITDRVIPLAWLRARPDDDADIAYLSRRRDADRRNRALSAVADRLSRTEALVLSATSPELFAFVVGQISGARPGALVP